ncbi:hypothetical protein ADL22_18745 [Streptomyces sp. NRRL F-4489]|uniref:hypothetical protein n=1 Tax=Streptomyces sp. NRRL F-4489 TaxID=1609095 RepID=UPI0007466AAE|nr:hypothetical protein [Streptomyces sp. NRRL F-4489]KUL38155.1 hypothetical protein ADL22_18745 [Streptomyces sp. NRRL F-4489]
MSLRSLVRRPVIAAVTVGLVAVASIGVTAPASSAVALRDYRCRHLDYDARWRHLDGYDCTRLYINHAPMEDTLIMRTGGRRWLYECEIVKEVVGGDNEIVGSRCNAI